MPPEPSSRPKASRASGADPEPPILPTDIGSLFNGLLGSALKKVLDDAGWPGHPLREVLDAAEASFPAEGHVTARDMRDSLTLALKAHGNVPVRVVGEHEATTASGGASPSTVLVALGDKDDLAAALRRLTKALPPPGEEPTTVRDIVIWARHWQNAPWALREKSPLAGRAVWLKVWDANGALIGPLLTPPGPLPQE